MGKIWFFIINTFIFSIFPLYICQESSDYGCEKNHRCDLCLLENVNCSWCSYEEFHSTTSKYTACNSKEKLIQQGCPEKNIISNKEPELHTVEDNEFTDILDETTLKRNQMKPQKMLMTLSPFEKQFINFQYRPAQDYPLDLYVLMDLTDTMTDDKETIVNLNEGITFTLKNLTKHFRLGFGSFADKNLMPFAHMMESHQENPCVFSKTSVCEKLYDFRHRFSFNNDVDKFVNAVKSSKNTGNVDNAEGGMDALMQVIVCDEEIGWRSNARQMILFVSDGISHFAGDGKLAGLVKPNDKLCHLDENGYYEKAEILDYPSLEQIYRVLQERKISIIFGVTETKYYEQVKGLLPENTFVGKLSTDSSNILSLIKQGYTDIASVINFEVTSDDNIEVIMYSDCNGNGEFVQTTKCTNIELGKTYNFRVEIKIKKSEKENYLNMNRKILIQETQLGKDKLVVDITLTSDCNCMESDKLLNINCSENAELNCGKCLCKSGWTGRNCTCQEKYMNMRNQNLCFAPGDKIKCSGLGDCNCNECKCDQGFSGKFCECLQCPIDTLSGAECGGLNRGRCDCGKCICRAGWLGPACSCPESICISPQSNDTCSGNGICECGGCRCVERNGSTYIGQYCERCSNCDNLTCELFEPCVRMKLENDAVVCKTSNGIEYSPKRINEAYSQTDNKGTCILRITNENSTNFGCEYIYTYEALKDGNIDLTIYEQCPGILQSSTYLLSMSILIAILIGIISALIWKLYDYIRYKREYQRFVAETNKTMSNANTNSNPVYKSPITSYQVPNDLDMKIFDS